LQGFDAIQLTPVELGLSGCGENQFGIPELRWPASLAPESHTTQDAQKFRPARPQAEQEPEVYPPGGYVEDSSELRTKLADFFSILL
jgi:hypothetical protein